ncbi:hypothetical protein [Parerythrobacter lacustris]|uniref:Nuclear transport factor 2 family protein n=1 Tax=Parerythrobacter lacustris TaxID=2969984 RepID=A0ABT1XMG7_9SPHN|nr:hypothetical protein [Parerythrobacter lacustris]MCR2832856.1 hypothetical protein [Parerythrobacter lacustris]
MRHALKAAIAMLTLAAAPLHAQEPVDDTIYLTKSGEITVAVSLFFNALRSEDKTALARQMEPGGVITIHDRMDPAAPMIVFVSVAQHLENWLKSPPGIDEQMFQHTVLYDGDMAHVWGPYRFMANGETTHCGINSLSLVKREDGWKVANTSFTMERPERCDELGAPAAWTRK